MIESIIEWVKQLGDAEKLTLAGLVILVIGGCIKYFKKKKPSGEPGTQIKQEGENPTAVVVGEAAGHVAGGDIQVGVPSETILDRYENALIQMGAKDERIQQLEEQLSNPEKTQSLTGEESIQPSAEAVASAQAITDDDSAYARALKAIAEGENDQADNLLDDTQNVLDQLDEMKDQAQIKVYVARMENATYRGRHKDALDWCEKLEPLAGDDEQLLHKMFEAYYYNAQYTKAEPIMEHLLALEEDRPGSDPPQLATRLNDLAMLYRKRDRLPEAVPLMERALAIDEKTFGENHTRVAIRLNNLALLYQAEKRFPEAVPLMVRALAIDEKERGEEHPKVAIRLNNLATLYQAEKRFPEAEPLIERALAIDEKSIGVAHPLVACTLNNLAQLYQETNRLPEAEPLMVRALAILEARMGADHPDTVTAKNNLMILRATLKEAEE